MTARPISASTASAAPGSARDGLSAASRGLVALVFLAAFLLQMRQPLTANVSWLITVSERMLAGQVLYVDIFELNPPMCALLYLPWVWLGQVFGIAPEGLVVVATLGLAAASLWLGSRILAAAQVPLDRGDWWFVGALALTILPGASFAEREHFALLGVLPMLCTAAARAVGATPPLRQRIVAGIAGGLAMAVKPHFALALLLPALWAAVSARSWRPILALENVVAAGVVLAFWAVAAQVFPAFFTTMLPLANAVYAADRLALVPLLFGRPTWPFWAFVVVFTILYAREARRAPVAAFLAGALGFFLAYLAQGKGFAYQLLPAEALVTMALLLVFAERNRSGNDWRAAVPKIVATAVVALPVLAAAAPDPIDRQLFELLRPYGPGLKLANLTPALETASPLDRELRGTLVNSEPFLWMALGAIRIEATDPPPAKLAELQTIEQRERDMLRADLARKPPDAVLAGRDAFDWLGWAKADPAIAAQLAGYTIIGHAGADSDMVTVLLRPGLQPKP